MNTKIIIMTFVALLLPVLASAQQVEIDGIYYYCDLVEKQAEVIGPSSSECTGEIIIPSTVIDQGVTCDVTSIRESAFIDCSGITSVIIGSNVTSIGDEAFFACSSLTSIIIPSSVTYIGDRAFFRGSSQSSLFIPKSVTYIGEGAFSYWPNLTSIEVDADNTKYDSRDDCNAVIETETNSLIVGCMSSTIPYSVTSIGNDAFSGSGLSYVGSPVYSAIPSNVTRIGEYAFANTAISAIAIPNSVTEIEQGTFFGCADLYYVSIPNSVTSIGIDAFGACSSLQYINIPSSVTSIGNAAFGYSGLKGFDVPNGVSTIGYGTFFYCPDLASITIPSSVTNIDSFAFFECPNLSSIWVESGNSIYDSRDNCNAIIETGTNSLIVGGISSTIPNSVTSIGFGAFSGRNLTSVTIPISVVSIGDLAFGECRDLSTVTILNPTPIPITSWTFSNRSNATLYVPNGSKDAYSTADWWKEFKNISEIILGDVNGDGVVTVTDVVIIVNIILGKNTNAAYEKAADLNKDGYVNVTDVVMTVNIILGK